MKLLIIDTFNFLHRAYHALPKTFTDSEGNPINAVYGFTSMLINVLNSQKPTHVIAAIDISKPTFRIEEFTGYKAQRKPMDDELAQQIPKVMEVLDAFSVKKLSAEGYEADDVIGTVAARLDGKGFQTIIVSNDRDMWQLVGSNVTVMNPKKGGVNDFIGPEQVKAKMNLTPSQIPDYKGLKGDPSDNIPGVYGVGDVSATKLLDKYTTVEGIYEHIDAVEPASLQKKLVESAEMAVLSKKLATIDCDIPITFDINECVYNFYDPQTVKSELQKYNFRSLIKRMGLDEVDERAKKPELTLFS